MTLQSRPHGPSAPELVDRDALANRYAQVRAETERLAAPLAPEDQVLQSMPDASPTKWHRAHTTWFFETFILGARPGHVAFDPGFAYLFNSYYEGLGPFYARPERGLISRPGVAEVAAYRAHVDAAMQRFMRDCDERVWMQLGPLIELGLHHEQQHQELLLTDILHAFSRNPLHPSYQPQPTAPQGAAPALAWIDHEGGLVEIGHAGATFAFDNESPRHKTFLAPFRMASRAVTNEEFIAFIDAGGYADALLWLSDGWATVRSQSWVAPAYWQRIDGVWHALTLAGLAPVAPAAPVAHVSYYEADAFARWAGRRLPSEAEWEVVAADLPVGGNMLGSAQLRPCPAVGSGAVLQMFGDVWEWTQSAYLPYPGFKPAPGQVAEYNGKFMSGQMVLRGGSCVTPEGHIRPSYRNFFPPHTRWQFSGIRLADEP